MPTPVVIYAAKSTQDKHRSIDTQLDDGREKSAEEDWEVVGVFTDEKFSAYSGNRGKGLQEAKELAISVARERGEVCMLLAQASDRFARGEGDKPGAADALIEIWHQLRRADVHLRSVEDDGDLRDSPSVANLGHRAMMESKRKSGSVKKGHARRAAKGLPIGSTDPLGLRRGEDGFEPVASEVPTLERIFRELRAGSTQLGLARKLNREGIPTKTGGRWYQGTIRRIARNPIYKGMVVHQGKALPGTHDPVIDPVLWDEVNDLLDQRSKHHPGRGRGRPPIGSHLFHGGMLLCKCGALMLPRTERLKLADGGRSLYEVYVCSARARDVTTCSVLPVKRADVDLSVYRYFEQVGLDVAATREQLEGAMDARLSEARALLEQAEAEESRVAESLTRIRRDYTQDKISAEDWSSLKVDLTADLKAARAQVERFSAQATEATAMGAIQDAERDVLSKLTEIRKEIAGEINGASNVEGVRAAILRLFESFSIREPQTGETVHVDLLQRGRGLVIDPKPREQAVDGYDDEMLPVFRREPLYSAENNYAAIFAAAYTVPPSAATSATHATSRAGACRRSPLPMIFLPVS
jgi:site-specific DNA recombinase